MCVMSRVFEIKANIATISICCEVIRGDTTNERRGKAPHGITSRLLHFDHVSAKVAKHHSRQGSRVDPRKIKDAKALERQARALVGSGDGPEFVCSAGHNFEPTGSGTLPLAYEA
jgi:hypothetical protein